jgi:flagellar protein FlgJ
MSDADLALYKKSLPRIINQAGGNEKIIRTTLAINEYLIKEAEIADQVINREISPADGRAKMAALVNPLAQSGGSGATPGRRKFDAQGREIK